jgi:riboflavin biosynthesis pyrimidine reductase
MLQRCYNSSEDQFALPASIREIYGPFGFPDPADPSRPYVSANFVMSLDGRGSFRELPGRAGGKEVSRSADDRWLMDFIRAHHDAQLVGASTLRDEPGPDSKGWDYGIDDPELFAYRRDILKLGPQKIILLTASGEVDLGMNVFTSSRVEAWVLTGTAGEETLRAQLESRHLDRPPKIVVASEGRNVDMISAFRLLRRDHGLRSLLCEGGPTVYGGLLDRQLIDEDFRTISLQVIGKSTQPGVERPTTYGNVGFFPESAPWFRLVSLHYALPYHAFLRLRYQGPRKFSE